jgi:hypothetical protein
MYVLYSQAQVATNQLHRPRHSDARLQMMMHWLMIMLFAKRQIVISLLLSQSSALTISNFPSQELSQPLTLQETQP